MWQNIGSVGFTNIVNVFCIALSVCVYFSLWIHLTSWPVILENLTRRVKIYLYPPFETPSVMPNHATCLVLDILVTQIFDDGKNHLQKCPWIWTWFLAVTLFSDYYQSYCSIILGKLLVSLFWIQVSISQ